MRSGEVRTRSGDVYKPSAIRSYERALRDRVLPELGAKRLGDVQRRDVQRLADELLARGPRPVDDPQRAHAAPRDLPPRDRGRRPRGQPVRATSGSRRSEADASGSPRPRRPRGSSPRCPSATARCGRPRFYAGLRRGELMALRWEDVDLADGRDPRRARLRREGPSPHRAEEPRRPAHGADRRRAPRRLLVEHKARERPRLGPRLRLERGHAVRAVEPLAPRPASRGGAPASSRSASTRRATRSRRLLIAAGVNAKAITTYMGHASIQTTYDLYGKLMPGSEAEAAALVDAYLARADTQRGSPARGRVTCYIGTHKIERALRPRGARSDDPFELDVATSRTSPNTRRSPRKTRSTRGPSATRSSTRRRGRPADWLTVARLPGAISSCRSRRRKAATRQVSPDRHLRAEPSLAGATRRTPET